MANTYPNSELELTNTKIKKSVDSILESVNKYWEPVTEVDEDEVSKSIDKYWPAEVDVLSTDRKYINALPKTYKDKTLRYIDIFRENPELVSDYLATLKKFGSEKDAKDAGATNILFYPNKINKFFKR